MRAFVNLSAKIYDPKRIKDYRRMAVFIVRSLSQSRQMMDLIRFFDADALRREISRRFPCLIEQATRHFFYHRSTVAERARLIKEHFLFLSRRLQPEAVRSIYLGDGLVLWRQNFGNEVLSLRLSFRSGHKKEGLLALTLEVGSRKVYDVVFWIAPASHGAMALFIGSLQGIPGGAQLIHDLTKFMFGYRTKNLLLYGVRIVARQLGLDRIYAVSNRGYYANNHFRLDRKLRTSLDGFWLETGGQESADPRFFELPVTEPRKNDQEVPPHKRALYRKRFAFLDQMAADMARAPQACAAGGINPSAGLGLDPQAGLTLANDSRNEGWSERQSAEMKGESVRPRAA